MIKPFRIVAIALLAVMSCMSCVTAVIAEKRVALVIGNGAYRHVAGLPNPPNDASDIADSLARLGFSVTRLTNPGFDDFRRALIELGRQASGADMAVVYCAGLGMEIGGENY